MCLSLYGSVYPTMSNILVGCRGDAQSSMTGAASEARVYLGGDQSVFPSCHRRTNLSRSAIIGVTNFDTCIDRVYYLLNKQSLILESPLFKKVM